MEQLAQEEQDAKDAIHDSKQAAIKAEMAKLKAEHSVPTGAGLLGQAVMDTYVRPPGFNPEESPGFKEGAYVRNLIGSGYKWLTEPQY